MKKISQWVIVCLIATILLSVAIPIVINCLYSKGAELNEPNTIFYANDLLSYCGAALTCIGTIVLGAVAIIQSRESNSIAQSLLNIEIEKQKTEQLMQEMEIEKHKAEQKLHEMEIEKFKSEKLIEIELKDAKHNIPSNCTVLNDCAKEKHIFDSYCFELSNKNNMITRIVIQCNDIMIVSKEITILPDTVKDYCIWFSDYRDLFDKSEIEVDLLLYGKYSIVTLYKFSLIRQSHTKKIQLANAAKFITCMDESPIVKIASGQVDPKS